jgi:hypothetical protein
VTRHPGDIKKRKRGNYILFPPAERSQGVQRIPGSPSHWDSPSEQGIICKFPSVAKTIIIKRCYLIFILSQLVKMLCLSYYYLYFLFKKIRHKCRIDSAWQRGEVEGRGREWGESG